MSFSVSILYESPKLKITSKRFLIITPFVVNDKVNFIFFHTIKIMVYRIYITIKKQRNKEIVEKIVAQTNTRIQKGRHQIL